MSSRLLSTLLVSGALLVAGQISAADAPVAPANATAAPAPNASFVPSDLAAKSHEEVAANPTKKHKKAKATAPVATAKESRANISGTGTITGPVSLTGGAVAAPAPAPATK